MDVVTNGMSCRKEAVQLINRVLPVDMRGLAITMLNDMRVNINNMFITRLSNIPIYLYAPVLAILSRHVNSGVISVFPRHATLTASLSGVSREDREVLIRYLFRVGAKDIMTHVSFNGLLTMRGMSVGGSENDLYIKVKTFTITV